MNNKLIKSIKILLIIFAALFFVLILAFVVLSFFNLDAVPDKTKYIIYDTTKFTTLGVCVSALVVPIVLSIEHFKQHKPNINTYFKTTQILIVFAALLVEVLMLLMETTKYGVRIDLWYAHRSVFVSLIVLIQCLYIDFALSHTNKYLYGINKKTAPDQVLFKTITNTRFITQSVWIVIGAILGIVTMVIRPNTAQYCSSWVWILILFTVVNLIFISISQYKKQYFAVWLIITIIGAMLSVFLISSHYLMFPARIIDAIKINYFVGGWSFSLALAFVPTTIIACKKAI